MCPFSPKSIIREAPKARRGSMRTRATQAIKQPSQDVAPGTSRWETLESLGPSHLFPRGVELFRQGSIPRYVYHLESGLVKLVFCSEDGREVITNLSKPGSLLGASALILEESHPVSGVTVQRCRLRYIAAAEFHATLTTDPQFCIYVNRLLSREVSDHLVHAGELGTIDARFRLEQLLWDMISSLEAVEGQSPVRLQPPIKHSEIAELIAVTPQYLSRLLKQFERDGVLRREKGSLIISDPRALWHRENC
jgi:CRP/FNR family transcriptional regulator, cyclic AMP receptor protein